MLAADASIKKFTAGFVLLPTVRSVGMLFTINWLATVTLAKVAWPPAAATGTPLASIVIPKLSELPPLLPPVSVAVVVRLAAPSVASGQPSLSLSVSK